jgi:hypothetical protein
MIVIFTALALVLLIIGIVAFIMALKDADHWLHRRFNPNKKYADQGLSTEMADPEELEEITTGDDPIPTIHE